MAQDAKFWRKLWSFQLVLEQHPREETCKYSNTMLSMYVNLIYFNIFIIVMCLHHYTNNIYSF